MEEPQLDLFENHPEAPPLRTFQKEYGGLNFSKGSQGFDTLSSWVVKSIIPTESFGTIWGPSGTLKSFLMIDLCCSVSTGTPWCGKAVQQAGVVYVAAEGQAGVAKRIKAWEVARGRDTEHLYVLGHSVTMSAESELSTLIEAIQTLEEMEDIKIRLVVLDTLARCYDGDENASRDMSLFVKGCDRLKTSVAASVVCVHHSGRDESRGARGSTALKAACDFEFQVKRKGKDPLLTLINTKQKDDSESPNYEIEFESVDLGIRCEEDLPLTSLTRVQGGSTSNADDSLNNDPILRILGEQHGGQATRIELRQSLYPAQATLSEAERKSLSRSLKILQNSGRITILQKSTRASDNDIITLTH